MLLVKLGAAFYRLEICHFEYGPSCLAARRTVRKYHYFLKPGFWERDYRALKGKTGFCGNLLCSAFICKTAPVGAAPATYCN